MVAGFDIAESDGVVGENWGACRCCDDVGGWYDIGGLMDTVMSRKAT